jgi:hypothetical protein
MWTFAIAGSLYLVGVGIVLMIKPSLMFTPDGDWKEFGIGQREDRYTPFPFWLFCLTWALVTYFLVLVVEPYLFPEISREVYKVDPLPVEVNEEVVMNNKRRNNNRRRPVLEEDIEVDEAMELPKGYYVLNKKATRLSGVPKYVYLGPEEPSE